MGIAAESPVTKMRQIKISVINRSHTGEHIGEILWAAPRAFTLELLAKIPLPPKSALPATPRTLQRILDWLLEKTYKFPLSCKGDSAVLIAVLDSR